MTQQRHSKKRDAIRAVLAQARDHPSAEMLYERLKPDCPGLSLGTVYRNLQLFREEGTAICAATVAGQERFDGRTEPHAHFVCRLCGRVDDVQETLPDAALRETKVPGRLEDYALIFYGLCKDCLK